MSEFMVRLFCELQKKLTFVNKISGPSVFDLGAVFCTFLYNVNVEQTFRNEFHLIALEKIYFLFFQLNFYIYLHKQPPMYSEVQKKN